jgi:hypothetical protein
MKACDEQQLIQDQTQKCQLSEKNNIPGLENVDALSILFKPMNDVKNKGSGSRSKRSYP